MSFHFNLDPNPIEQSVPDPPDLDPQDCRGWGGGTFLLRGEAENASDEDPVGDDLQPGVGEARRLGRTQDVQHVAVGRQHL